MGDRRQGERRSPEKGVIKIKTRNAIIWGILFIFLFIAIGINIVLWTRYIKVKTEKDVIIDHYYNYNNITTNNEVTSDDKPAVNNYSCDINIIGDKTSIKPGEKAIYEIKASNINADEGIIVFETNIKYDENAFDLEVLSDSESKWNKTELIEGFLTMSRSDLTASSDDQVIAKIELTAKQDAKEGDHKVDFTLIKLTGESDKSFNVSDKSISLAIVK